jgi:hypothetical protein
MGLDAMHGTDRTNKTNGADNITILDQFIEKLRRK